MLFYCLCNIDLSVFISYNIERDCLNTQPAKLEPMGQKQEYAQALKEEIMNDLAYAKKEYFCPLDSMAMIEGAQVITSYLLLHVLTDMKFTKSLYSVNEISF